MERLWRPLCVAALNCPPEQASASLAAATLRELVVSGGNGMRLLMPVETFGRAFVEPLARRVERDGAILRFERRLIGLDLRSDRLSGLEFETDRIALHQNDALVLCRPLAGRGDARSRARAPAGPLGRADGTFRCCSASGCSQGSGCARQPLPMALLLSRPNVGHAGGRRRAFREAERGAGRRMLAWRCRPYGALRRSASLARHPLAAGRVANGRSRSLPAGRHVGHAGGTFSLQEVISKGHCQIASKAPFGLAKPLRGLGSKIAAEIQNRRRSVKPRRKANPPA